MDYHETVLSVNRRTGASCLIETNHVAPPPAPEPEPAATRVQAAVLRSEAVVDLAAYRRVAGAA